MEQFTYRKLGGVISDPLSFMVARPLAEVAEVIRATGRSTGRGHYGSNASEVAQSINKETDVSKLLYTKVHARFADGLFYVLFGYDSGGNHNGETYPFFFFQDGIFEYGRLEGSDLWTPGNRALLKR